MLTRVQRESQRQRQGVGELHERDALPKLPRDDAGDEAGDTGADLILDFRTPRVDTLGLLVLRVRGLAAAPPVLLYVCATLRKRAVLLPSRGPAFRKSPRTSRERREVSSTQLARNISRRVGR